VKLYDLPPIEREAIDILLEGNAVLQSQLRLVRSVARSATGAGVYVVFELDNFADPLEEKTSFHIADVFATSSVCEEIGFILFVKNGLIEYLEGYTHSGAYPSYENCEYSLSRPTAA
jgi:hypothetical protein